jgi:AcrR family transcriptional regulator
LNTALARSNRQRHSFGEACHQSSLVIVFTKMVVVARGKREVVEVSGSRYAGRSADERRGERRRRLLDAAMELAGGEGISALRVRAVCVRAGLNDRYFYESFSDCDELLLAVYEDQAAILIARLMSVIDDTADQELRSRIRAVIDAGLDFCDEPRRRRLLEESQSTQALRARRHELATLLAQMMLTQGRAVLGDNIATDRNYEMAALTVVNGLIELGATWWRGDLDASRDQVAEFMVAMILTSADIGTRLENELSARE